VAPIAPVAPEGVVMPSAALMPIEVPVVPMAGAEC
jgi:hypothetical protein